MPETFERFVATSGTDSPDNGLRSTDAPLRTISYATQQIAGALRNAGSSQTGTIWVAPGTYAEQVVLTDRMRLRRQDGQTYLRLTLGSDSLTEVLATELQPAVRLLRPSTTLSIDGSAAPARRRNVVLVNGSDILIEGIFVDGASQPQHGIFIHESEGVTIRGCKVANCHSEVEVPPGCGDGTRQHPYTCRPQEMRDGSGAGVSIWHSRNVRIETSWFDNNRTRLAYKQVLSSDQIARLRAGLSTSERIAFDNGINNDALERAQAPEPERNGGGHVYAKQARLSVQSSVFENGFCGGRGAGLALSAKAYATVEFCTFRNNESYLDGGAIAVNDPAVDDFSRDRQTFRSCRFISNLSHDDGGAVYLTSKTIATLEGCAFLFNRSESNGGALRVTFGSNVDVRRSTFHDNRANIDAGSKLSRNFDGGGAIAAANATLVVSHCHFDSNHCSGFAGGAIYFITAAYDAGAERAARLAEGHTFESILRDSYGVRSASLTVENSTMWHNTTLGMTCAEDRCTLSPNAGFAAKGAGGAVYVLASRRGSFAGFPVNVVIRECDIVNNPAGHSDVRKQADVVADSIDLLRLEHERIESSNPYVVSVMHVANVDTTSSDTWARALASGQVYRE
jgi:predicted outer membrane repeat protein